MSYFFILSLVSLFGLSLIFTSVNKFNLIKITKRRLFLIPVDDLNISLIHKERISKNFFFTEFILIAKYKYSYKEISYEGDRIFIDGLLVFDCEKKANYFMNKLKNTSMIYIDSVNPCFSSILPNESPSFRSDLLGLLLSGVLLTFVSSFIMIFLWYINI